MFNTSSIFVLSRNPGRILFRARLFALVMTACAVVFFLVNTPLYSIDVKEKIKQLHDRYRINQQKVGIYFKRLNDGKSLYRQNIDSSFVPASNMKLVTVFTALRELGSDSRFLTELYIGVDAENRKHLYVRGTGDPTISQRSRDSAEDIFKDWAKKLRSKGHRRIPGNLYLDGSAYEMRTKPLSWERYNHTYWYTAPVDALNLNDNCVLVRVVPRTPGQQARVTVQPEGTPLNIQNQTETVADPSKSHIQFERLKNTWTVKVSGGIQPGTARTEWVTVPYPLTYFGSVLKTSFQQYIPIQGRVQIGKTPENIRNSSPEISFTTPVTNVLKTMLKESQNLYAETVLKQIAYQKSGKGSWERAVKEVRRCLKSADVPVSGCRFVDGSGLSRENRLTPRAIVVLLNRWLDSPSARDHIAKLPISGIDGTLENRLNKSPYRGRIVAKTGTLSGVKALSGIAGRDHLSDDTTSNQPVIIFSILLNQTDLPPGNGRVFIDQVARTALDLIDTGK